MVINEKHVIFLQGGIGDLLQMLPFIDANRNRPIRYWCVTHFQGINKFFKSIGIQPERIYIFDTHEKQVEIMNSLPRDEMLFACPRSYYFNEDPFAPEKPAFTNGKPTIGVHVGGSSYSIGVQKQFGFSMLSSLISFLMQLQIFSKNGCQLPL